MLTSYLGVPRSLFDSRGLTHEGYQLVSPNGPLVCCRIMLMLELAPVSERSLQSGVDGQMDCVLLRSAIRGGNLKGQ